MFTSCASSCYKLVERIYIDKQSDVHSIRHIYSEVQNYGNALVLVTHKFNKFSSTSNCNTMFHK